MYVSVCASVCVIGLAKLFGCKLFSALSASALRQERLFLSFVAFRTGSIVPFSSAIPEQRGNSAPKLLERQKTPSKENAYTFQFVKSYFSVNSH